MLRVLYGEADSKKPIVGYVGFFFLVAQRLLLQLNVTPRKLSFEQTEVALAGGIN